MSAETYTVNDGYTLNMKIEKTTIEVDMAKNAPIKAGDTLYMNADGTVSPMKDTDDLTKSIGVALETFENKGTVSVLLAGSNEPNMNGDVLETGAVSGVIYANSFFGISSGYIGAMSVSGGFGLSPSHWSMYDKNEDLEENDPVPEEPELPNPYDRWDFV
jgi:hypothetical protein